MTASVLGFTEPLERETGIEPATNSLEGCDSTTELLPPYTLAQLDPLDPSLRSGFRQQAPTRKIARSRLINASSYSRPAITEPLLSILPVALFAVLFPAPRPGANGKHGQNR